MEDMRMEQPREGLIRQELISYEKEGDILIKKPQLEYIIKMVIIKTIRFRSHYNV